MFSFKIQMHPRWLKRAKFFNLSLMIMMMIFLSSPKDIFFIAFREAGEHQHKRETLMCCFPRALQPGSLTHSLVP